MCIVDFSAPLIKSTFGNVGTTRLALSFGFLPFANHHHPTVGHEWNSTIWPLPPWKWKPSFSAVKQKPKVLRDHK